jgi:hypothetical protein
MEGDFERRQDTIEKIKKFISTFSILVILLCNRYISGTTIGIRFG